MPKSLLNRRQFIQLIALTSSSWTIDLVASTRSTDKNNYYSSLPEPWLTLSTVQEHLFPADNSSPGAKDIFALRYLQNALNRPDTDTEEKEFILNGVNWLNDLSLKKHTQIFNRLDEQHKETVLRQIDTSQAGSRWLSLLMTYLIESLLSDPVYGGNKEQLGWKWLDHQPGFPTPSIDKAYYKLGHQTRRETKS